PFKHAIQAFQKALLIENQLIKLHSIDFENNEDDVINAYKIIDEISADECIRFVAYRYGKRYLPNMHKMRSNEIIKDKFDVKKDSVFLVTGGMTGLGFEVCKSLVGKGAKKIFILGRTPIPDDLS